MDQLVQIVTDSSCDLPPEVVQELGIKVVPLNLHFGPEVYLDGELTAEQFWAKARQPHPPKTSQPAVGVYEQVYARLVDQGHQVLCVALTGQHSGTFNSAYLAAQKFGGAVQVFDSLSLSLGLGFQALAAARAARFGLSMEEILDQLEGVRDRMRVLIVLDTIEYLRSGGRAAAFIAVADRMTRALNIKVIINLVHGQLRLLAAARSFSRGIRRVLEMAEQLAPLERAAVVHARNLQAAQQTAEKLAERTGLPGDTIWVKETRGVLAAHGGPGVLGVMVLPEAAQH